jgi:hypothetical protein
MKLFEGTNPRRTVPPASRQRLSPRSSHAAIGNGLRGAASTARPPTPPEGAGGADSREEVASADPGIDLRLVARHIRAGDLEVHEVPGPGLELGLRQGEGGRVVQVPRGGDLRRPALDLHHRSPSSGSVVMKVTVMVSPAAARVGSALDVNRKSSPKSGGTSSIMTPEPSVVRIPMRQTPPDRAATRMRSP